MVTKVSPDTTNCHVCKNAIPEGDKYYIRLYLDKRVRICSGKCLSEHMSRPPIDNRVRRRLFFDKKITIINS